MLLVPVEGPNRESPGLGFEDTEISGICLRREPMLRAKTYLNKSRSAGRIIWRPGPLVSE
jgi:hypothetical protein